MNHDLLTEHDLHGARNLHAEFVIQTMYDLDPINNKNHFGRGKGEWVAEFKAFKAQVEARPVFSRVRRHKAIDVIRKWAVSELEHSEMRGLYGGRRREQLRYNAILRRWIDRVYGDGDAMLSAFVVLENPGTIREHAENAGMKTSVAKIAEKKVVEMAGVQGARLLEKLEAESAESANVDSRGFEKAPEDIREEIS